MRRLAGRLVLPFLRDGELVWPGDCVGDALGDVVGDAVGDVVGDVVGDWLGAALGTVLAWATATSNISISKYNVFMV